MTEFEIGKRVTIANKNNDKATIVKISKSGAKLGLVLDSGDGSIKNVSASKCSKARGRAPAHVAEMVAPHFEDANADEKPAKSKDKTSKKSKSKDKAKSKSKEKSKSKAKEKSKDKDEPKAKGRRAAAKSGKSSSEDEGSKPRRSASSKKRSKPTSKRRRSTQYNYQ